VEKEQGRQMKRGLNPKEPLGSGYPWLNDPMIKSQW